MIANEEVQGLLERVRKGEGNVHLSFIAEKVLEGIIGMDEALNSVREHLETVISQYEGKPEHEQRLSEVQEALKALNEGRTVEYRGIRLSRDSISSNLKGPTIHCRACKEFFYLVNMTKEELQNRKLTLIQCPSCDRYLRFQEGKLTFIYAPEDPDPHIQTHY